LSISFSNFFTLGAEGLNATFFQVQGFLFYFLTVSEMYGNLYLYKALLTAVEAVDMDQHEFQSDEDEGEGKDEDDTSGGKSSKDELGKETKDSEVTEEGIDTQPTESIPFAPPVPVAPTLPTIAGAPMAPPLLSSPMAPSLAMSSSTGRGKNLQKIRARIYSKCSASWPLVQGLWAHGRIVPYFPVYPDEYPDEYVVSTEAELFQVLCHSVGQYQRLREPARHSLFFCNNQKSGQVSHLSKFCMGLLTDTLHRDRTLTTLRLESLCRNSRYVSGSEE
jgi:hypothetical protein